MIPLYVIAGYLVLLLALGFVSTRFFRGTSADYFVASRSIGPFMLLMSVFGTTMTAFALVGSSGEAYTTGIGVYGLMASYSGLIHSACFFLIGIKLWAIGKRYGYVTQCQFFRERFESPALGYVLFPILVLLIIPYLLIGLIGAGAVIRGLTVGKGGQPGTFPELFASTNGAIPPEITALVISLVVLTYVFLGGVRSTAWANTFQTLVFMVTGLIAFVLIARALGGLSAASRAVLDKSPQHLMREGMIGKWQFFTYAFIPLSVGMFPHLFQHWLTAKSAKTFRLTVVAHPLCIMVVWVPCVLIGVWAVGKGMTAPSPNAVLAKMVAVLVHSELLTGLLMAGVLAAIMSSLDSQFMCIGTMFTNDIVLRIKDPATVSDRQKLWTGRVFVVAVVAVTYLLTLVPWSEMGLNVFDLGVWCFSGFGGLFPLVFAAVYWKRATKAGAIAAVVATAAVWLGLLLYDLIAFEGHGHEEFLLIGVMPVTAVFATCLLTLVVVSLLTPAPSEATIRRFFPKALHKA